MYSTVYSTKLANYNLCDYCVVLSRELRAMATQSVDIKKAGYLEKRQRGRNHPKTDGLKFQQRYCELTTDSLIYYKNRKKEERGSFKVDRIKIIEALDSSVFKKDFCFQIGDNDEVLYFACVSIDERSDWMKAFELVAAARNNIKFPTHHPNKYSNKAKKWLCCNQSKSTEGCAASHGEPFGPPMMRRSKLKDENNRKPSRMPKPPDSGYYSERESRDSQGLDERLSNVRESIDGLNKAILQHMTCLQSYEAPDTPKITSIKFISRDLLLLTTEDYSVQIYDVPSNAVIHNISLTHPISSIDWWNGYLLIASSLVHIVDTRQGPNNWNRTVVLDLKEESNKKVSSQSSQHLAVFNINGEFVTASTDGNNIVFWPQPLEDCGVMTKTNGTIELCGGKIFSLFSVDTTLFVTRQLEQSVIDVFEWLVTEKVHLQTIQLGVTIDTQKIAVSEDKEYMYLVEHDTGVKEFSIKTRNMTLIHKSEDKITSLTATQEGDDYFLITGFRNGNVYINNTQSQEASNSLLPTNSAVSSAVTAVTYRREDNMIAVGHENGSLTVWGSTGTLMGQKKSTLELLEITKFSIYMPGSFSRHPIIADTFNFEADHRGGLFVNRPSYSLKIPSGAIKKGECVNIQTGIITCTGSDRFQVPDDYSVVSSMFWFCSDHEIEFQKALSIELQHCAEDYQTLTILKAKCTASSRVFRFEPQGQGISEGTEYATFETNHFCLFCIGIRISDQARRRFCVVPIEKPYIENEKQVIFCVCYHLDTCLKAVKIQHKDEAFYHINTPIPVSVKDDRIRFECRSDNAALKSGSNEVLVNDIDYLHMTEYELYMKQESKTYPPRVIYQIGNINEDTVVIHFSGLDKQMYYEIIPRTICCASNDEQCHGQKFMPGSARMKDSIVHKPCYIPFTSCSGD